MLIIMAGAYFLDEQTRLQSFGQAWSWIPWFSRSFRSFVVPQLFEDPKGR